MFALILERAEYLRNTAQRELDALKVRNGAGGARAEDEDYDMGDEDLMEGLKEMGRDGGYEQGGAEEEQERLKREIDSMIARAKVPARKDAKSEEYEVKPGSFHFQTPVPASQSHQVPATSSNNEDTEMGGMGTAASTMPMGQNQRQAQDQGPDQPPRRTAKVIREELHANLRQLIDRGVSEMEAYDGHAANTRNFYVQAWERRTGQPGSSNLPPRPPPGMATQGLPPGSNNLPPRPPSGLATQGLGMGGGYGSGSASAGGHGSVGGNGSGSGSRTGGILSNRHEQSPVDVHALRRMSTGMPFVGAGSPREKQGRVQESMEDIARGSK
jgi:hypothetical protein